MSLRGGLGRFFMGERFESIKKPFALSRVFLLSSGGESAILAKKKALSRSGLPLSTHVVLKTRYVSPNIHVRRY